MEYYFSGGFLTYDQALSGITVDPGREHLRTWPIKFCYRQLIMPLIFDFFSADLVICG